MAGIGATGLLAACGEGSPGQTAEAPASSTTPKLEQSGMSSGPRYAGASTNDKKADAAKAASIAASTGIGTDGDAGELGRAARI